MTKEQKRLLQGVKIGSVVSFTTYNPYSPFNEFGIVKNVAFTLNSAILTVIGIDHRTEFIIDIEQIDSIITNKRVIKSLGF